MLFGHRHRHPGEVPPPPTLVLVVHGAAVDERRVTPLATGSSHPLMTTPRTRLPRCRRPCIGRLSIGTYLARC